MRNPIRAGAVLAAFLSGFLICGCSGRSALSGFDPGQSSIYIKKDGSVSSASVEQTDQNYYSAEDLTAFVNERVEAYNSQAGGADGQTAPVQVASCTVEESQGGQTLTCILDYDSAETLMAFNQEIQNPEVAFTALVTDSVSALSKEEDFSQAVFLDAKGAAAEASKVTEKGDLRAVRIEGAGLVQTEGQIVYATQGCEIQGKSLVQTPSEGVSYIVFQ